MGPLLCQRWRSGCRRGKSRWAQFGGSAKPSSAIASGRQAGAGPFSDHGPLELSETAKHLHDHEAGRGCVVHRLGDTSEAGAGVAYLFHDMQEVF
jgi:hypothetical protein